MKKVVSYFFIIFFLLAYILKPDIVNNILSITLGRLLVILAILYLSYTHILFGLLFTLILIIIMSIKN